MGRQHKSRRLIERSLFAVTCVLLCLASIEGVTAGQAGVSPQTRPDPLARYQWWFTQRAYPLGYIPAGAAERALQQIQQAHASRAPSAIRANNWTNIGPAPFVGVDWVRPMAGRVDTIAIDPNNAAHWLIGASNGGIWESQDSGTNWAPRTDDQSSLAMGWIAFAPSAAGTVYAGTGDAMPSPGGYAGGGLLRSMDGGTTWQPIPGSLTTFARAAIKRVIVSPADANTLLVASTLGIAGRGGSYPPGTPTTGVFKSINGGTDWTPVLTGTASALVANPGDFSGQYAALGSQFGDAANGVYRSTTSGDSFDPIAGPWTVMGGGVGRIELAIGTSATSTLYVSIQKLTPNKGLLGLWRTDNAWDVSPSWVGVPFAGTDDGTGNYGYCGWDVTGGGSANNQCWYNHVLSVDPTNAGILYAGGTPLWKCTNCGPTPTWTEVSQNASTNGIHVDHHSLAWVGTSQLLAGNDGGLFSTTNGGATWSSVDNGLATILFYGGSIHPTNPNFALGGAQDNSTIKRPSSTSTWQELGGGDGSDNAISTVNPDTNWAFSDQNLFIKRTVDANATRQVVVGAIDTTAAPFIARFQKCPSNDDVFIAGTNLIWRANNFFSSAPAVPTWAANSPVVGPVSALAFAPSDATCSSYAFGTSTGALRLTTNGGVSWSDINTGADVPGRFVTGVGFSATDANVLYVALSGFDEATPGKPGHVFKTINALAATPTWNNVTPPVNIPVDSIVVDPQSSDNVFLGTDNAVWQTSNGGTAWTFLGPATGMPNVPVYDMKISRATNNVFAFTYGRSAFVMSLLPSFKSYLPIARRAV